MYEKNNFKRIKCKLKVVQTKTDNPLCLNKKYKKIKLSSFVPLLLLNNNTLLSSIILFILMMAILFMFIFIINKYMLNQQSIKNINKKKKQVSKNYKINKIQLIKEKEEALMDNTKLTDKDFYDYSLVASLCQGSENLKKSYFEIKNFIMLFNDIKLEENWKSDKFMHKNKPLFTLKVEDDTLEIYFKIDPRTIFQRNCEVIYTKDETFKDTPYMIALTDRRHEDYVITIIGLILKDIEMSIAYTPRLANITYKNTDELLELDLIRPKMAAE